MSEVFLFNVDGEYSGFTPEVNDVSLGGVTYKASVVKRGDINITDNFAKSQVTFTFDLNSAFALSLLLNLPETPINVTIYKDGNLYWEGHIDDIKGDEQGITIICNSLYSYIKNAGEPKRLGLTCRHNLYGEGCGVAQASYATSFTVSNITSNIISLAGFSPIPNYYTNGIATINGQTRKIVDQLTASIQITYPFNGIQSGTLFIYPGCNLTESDCQNKFSNLLNCGAFARIPPKNPWAANGAL